MIRGSFCWVLKSCRPVVTLKPCLTRTIVIGMVEHVEEVSRESHVHALVDPEILEQREIHVPGSRSLVKRPGVGIYNVRRRPVQSSRAIGQYLRNDW